MGETEAGGAVATAPSTPASGNGSASGLLSALRERRGDIQRAWVAEQLANVDDRARVDERETLAQSAAILDELLRAAVESGGFDLASPQFAGLTGLLSSLSADRARRGSTPSETALMVYGLRDSFVVALEDLYRSQPEVLLRETRRLNRLVDGLGLLTFSAFAATRESIILEQQTQLLELSTPVVTLWEGVLAVPLIGTLDSARTQTVMENLLEAVVETRSRVAIIDITGVPVVDTVVAQHLIKTVQATRLMGAEAIISGIRPQIAQTVVHLGVEMGDILTKATLADAFRAALAIAGKALERDSGAV